MPQHEMPFDCPEDVIAFDKLDSFAQGYIQAIFFTECHGDNPELEFAVFGDMAPESLAKALHDCELFQKDNSELLARAAQLGEAQGCYDDERAGTDFWFTRNHHGAGFWDRGLGEVGDALTKAAHGYSSIDLYRGDDGKLYLS